MTGHIISDHALLRYMERVQGLDIKALKDNLLKRNPGIEAAVNSGATSITIEGATFVIKGKTVTSVIDGSSSGSRSSHLQKEIDANQRSSNKKARMLQGRKHN